MTAHDIIKAKRDGNTLTNDEIVFFADGVASGEIPDSQSAALLMALCLKGMNSSETAALASAMAVGGDRLDLSVLPGEVADKHSTGGVGDKTTLVVAPIVAACGINVAKMIDRYVCGAGLTADKLLSIPNLRLDFSAREMLAIANRYGLCLAETIGNLAPAEKKLGELRRLTATTECIPLIAASIMSKKIAAGTQNLVLDVKVGSGAPVKNVKDAKRLAREMVSIGSANNINVTALITDNNTPLGCAVGYSLEVIEAVNTLRGTGPADLTELCLALSAHLLHLCGNGTPDECLESAKSMMFNGLAFERFLWAVNAQGGDIGVLTDTTRFKKARFYRTLTAKRSGYISRIDAGECGRAAALLGAARKSCGAIDSAAGVVLEAKVGAFVKSGDIIATLYAENDCLFNGAEQAASGAFEFSREPSEPSKLIIDKVSNKN